MYMLMRCRKTNKYICGKRQTKRNCREKHKCIPANKRWNFKMGIKKNEAALKVKKNELMKNKFTAGK